MFANETLSISDVLHKSIFLTHENVSQYLFIRNVDVISGYSAILYISNSYNILKELETNTKMYK